MYGALAIALGSLGGTCDELDLTAEELDRLLANDQPHSAARWEQERVPEEVLVQTTAVENLVSGFARFHGSLLPAEWARSAISIPHPPPP
jgi:hypothetical protein